jgi:hypothetical protein
VRRLTDKGWLARSYSRSNARISSKVIQCG